MKKRVFDPHKDLSQLCTATASENLCGAEQIIQTHRISLFFSLDIISTSNENQRWVLCNTLSSVFAASLTLKIIEKWNFHKLI